MARPTINPKRGRVVRRPSRAAARKARERQERAFIVPVRRLESKQDAWIRQWVRKRWREDPNTILAKLTALKIPYQQAITNALYQSRIASYRAGRAEGKAIVDAAIKRALPPRKRQIVATVEELEAKPDPFANVAAEYGAWAQTLGDERWQRKIKSVRGTLQSGIEQGWGLQEAYHWEDPDGGRVSAFEATAGRGGPQENGRKGYTRVTDNPGVMPALGEKLDDHKGYELERIARTENTRAFSGGKLDSFKANPAVTGVEYVAIIDSRVTDLCESLDGQVMSIDDPRLKRWIPPRHVSCRSDIVPVFVFDDNPAPTVDRETTIKLQDPRTKQDYDFTYTPSRLKFMEDDSGDLSKIGFGRKNLMTVADAERARAGFVAPSKAEMVGQWLHPRSPAKAAATGARVTATSFVPAKTKKEARDRLKAIAGKLSLPAELDDLNEVLEGMEQVLLSRNIKLGKLSKMSRRGALGEYRQKLRRLPSRELELVEDSIGIQGAWIKEWSDGDLQTRNRQQYLKNRERGTEKLRQRGLGREADLLERSEYFSISDGQDRGLFTTSRHEAAHAVYFHEERESEWVKTIRGISDEEKYAISEYAGAGGDDELFAESVAAKALGLPLPKPIEDKLNEWGL